MADTATAPALARPATDKRDAILAAALGVIAKFGLHNAPMSAVAREAGVAVGTVYLYFPSKEAMINALYLEVLTDRQRILVGGDPASWPVADSPRVSLWESWIGLARWHLDHEEASNLIQQCRASGILTDETRAVEQAMEVAGLALFEGAIAQNFVRDLSRYVFWALFMGPIYVLAQMRDAGEVVVTDELLRATFDGVCRSVLPAVNAEP
jgi:TetR/AcrR family transcriptional regulator, repressor of fatR-cypB operon